MKEQTKRVALFLVLFVVGLGFGIGDRRSRASDDGADDMSDDYGERCKRVPSDVPTALVPPAGQCLKESLVGTGVQIYACSSGAWVFKAPEANLTKNSRFRGNHYLGPTWQLNDGSKVKGAPNPVKVPAPNPAADIPWLLLTVASEEGAGKLSDVTFVQRLHTTGGVAPTGSCTTEGSEARVPYTADYLFYHPGR